MNFYKVFILILTSFILGAFLTDYIAKNSQDITGNIISIPSSSINKSTDFSLIDTVFSIVKENFYELDTVEQSQLIDGAIRGMIESLGDSNSEFLNPERTERFFRSLSGDLEGIGAVVEKVSEGVKVERLLQGSPALESGVRSGDIILTANGVSLGELDLFDAVEEIRGPAGTQVILEILRVGYEDIQEIEIIRQKIQIPSVEFNIIEDNNFGYLILNQFGETSSSEFRIALGEARQSEVEGLIIDLRNNGGGFLESAVEILSEFVPRGEKLVSIRYRDSRLDTVFRSNNSGEIFDIPIVILINENSASAAEITAGALREYNKAIIIGKQSFGKGSVQQPYDIGDSLLKLTVAHWYTPLGVSIELEGIIPDVTIEFTEEDFENNFDRQLEEAKRLLNIFIEKNTIGLTIEEFKRTENISEDLQE